MVNKLTKWWHAEEVRHRDNPWMTWLWISLGFAVVTSLDLIVTGLNAASAIFAICTLVAGVASTQFLIIRNTSIMMRHIESFYSDIEEPHEECPMSEGRNTGLPIQEFSLWMERNKHMLDFNMTSLSDAKKNGKRAVWLSLPARKFGPDNPDWEQNRRYMVLAIRQAGYETDGIVDVDEKMGAVVILRK